MPFAKCSMYGCNSATYNRIGYILNFHRFPKDLKRQKKWKELCKCPSIMDKKYSSLWLCSLHFEKSCYANKLLKCDAIPTLKLAKNSVGLFNFYESANNQAGADTNGSNSIKSYEKDNATRQPKETIRIEQDASKESVIKEKPYNQPEEDDSESVNFSTSEDEGSDGEAKQVDWEQELSLASGSALSDSNPETSKSPHSSIPAEPIYQSLPIISKIASVTANLNKKTLMRSPVVKAVEECLDESEEDDCSTFASHVKTRMRKFDHEQKVIAQKLISDIMFMADTRQLQLASAIVNPPAQIKKVNNGMIRKPTGGSFSAYVLDSDEDDGPPLAKKQK